MPTTVWKFDRLMPRRRRNVSDAPVPASRQPAHFLVGRLRTVQTDGDHQPPDAARERPLHELHGLVAEPAGRGEVQEKQRAARLLDRRDHVVEIAAHEQLATGQVDPAELRPAAEEEPDLFRGHLVHALLLPDIAHLAAEVAVIRRDERHLVGELRRSEVRTYDVAQQSEFSWQHLVCRKTAPYVTRAEPDTQPCQLFTAFSPLCGSQRIMYAVATAGVRAAICGLCIIRSYTFRL